MDNENNVYPDFVPNQVLTNNQLNQLRNYLDQQNRLGRVRLTGTGIICGLNVRLENNKVIISDGFGVSSEGYLIELDNKNKTASTFSHWKKYTDPDLDEDGTIAYDSWQKADNKKTQRDILELSNSATGATGAKKLTAQQFKGRVLVVYLEQNKEQLDSCLVTDCDSKGVNVRFSVRVLLVKKDALQAVESCKSAKGKLIHIPRLHTKLPLASVEKSAQINEAYNTIIENQFEQVLITINKSYEEYAAILSLDEDIPKLLKNLEIIIKEPSQYSWDILNDIADAYNEFIRLACQLLSPCFAEQDFPRHLMLGSLEADEASYRHPFFPSRIRNVEHDELEQVRKLFLRILVLASSINLKESDEIAITPSHTTLYPLGKRALPFYYAPDTEPYWQPHMCCTTEEVWSYHFQKRLSEFDYANASFLRIEGHIDKTCENAINKIRELQQKLNLEFDVLTLNIKSEKEKESLVSLAQDIPGIEHTAGVVKGGTFILLCEIDEKNEVKVVADFSLTGQIPCCRYFQPPELPVKLSSISGDVTDGSKPVHAASVKLNPGNKEQKTGNEGTFQFEDLSPDTYMLQASIDSPIRATSNIVSVIVGDNGSVEPEEAHLKLNEPMIIDIGRLITDRRHLGGNLIPISADQPDGSAVLTAKGIYGQRIANYQALLSEIPAPVKLSAVAKLAHTFIHETIVNETAGDVIFKQYNQLVNQGLETLGRSNTAAANKVHYKSILSTASLALLDSLMMSSPETLGADDETAVRKVKLTLNNAGIPLAGFNNQWNAKQLKDELEVSSASKVTAILR